MRTRQIQRAKVTPEERKALKATQEARRQRGRERLAKLAAMTPEERTAFEEQERARIANIARENGKLGGRPPGYGIPMNAIEAMEKMKFRVKDEYKTVPEAVAVAGYANRRIIDVLAGRVFSRKAPSVLKAALAVRNEICEPVAQELHHSGGISLVHAVSAAAARIPEPVRLKADELHKLSELPPARVRTVEAVPVRVEAEVVPITAAKDGGG